MDREHRRIGDTFGSMFAPEEWESCGAVARRRVEDFMVARGDVLPLPVANAKGSFGMINYRSDGMPRPILDHYETIRLGALIEHLKRQPADNDLVFDFGGFSPTHLHTDRGYYDHLAVKRA
jgi:hypothetical protein